MSEKKDDGGPAFPCDAQYMKAFQTGDGTVHFSPVGFYGMTLRQYYAAHCPSDIAKVRVQKDAEKLVGRKVPENFEEQMKWNMDVEAKIRFLYADAMIVAEK